MIPAVAQTLAEILADGTSLISTEQIDFNHPGLRQDVKPALNLYCYDIQENNHAHQLDWHVELKTNCNKPPTATLDCSLRWFDVSFVLSAWEHTALGEQRLLSEVLMQLLRHQSLKEDLLSPALRGHGNLAMTVSAVGSADRVALWRALKVPLRPALYVTVTAPFNLQGAPSIQWESSREAVGESHRTLNLPTESAIGGLHQLYPPNDRCWEY